MRIKTKNDNEISMLKDKLHVCAITIISKNGE